MLKLRHRQGGEYMASDKSKPKHKVQKWGLAIVLFSVLGVITGLTSGILEVAIFYFIFAGLGLFFMFSSKPMSFFDNRRKNKAEANEKAIDAALAQLETTTGAKAFIAYEKLEAIVSKKGSTSSRSLSDLLASINFDKSRLDSRFLGSVANPAASIFGNANKRTIRVYQDWVIAGDLGYDFDISTRGNVTVDGSIQFDKKNNKVDTRTATLQLATQDWSHAFKILPDEADEARRILNQLAAIVEELKPKGLSTADIKDLMEKLMASSGKSPAEKLEELSNLRYQRLLTDQEFESAKSKILGI